MTIMDWQYINGKMNEKSEYMIKGLHEMPSYVANIDFNFHDKLCKKMD